MKRQRGRGRKPGGGHHNNHHQPNRTMESNGPEGKVRGPAVVIYERYLQLGRDASSSGDRVLAENFLQHADHYFRLVRAMQPAAPPPQERFQQDVDFDGEDDAGGEVEASASETAAPVEDQAEVEASDEGAPQPERGEGEFRRRRGRRNRFRPGAEGVEEGGGDGGERRERRERQPREAAAEPNEGFSDSPQPAFLRQE